MKEVFEVVSDDMDGTKDATTVTFAFEGRAWEIDLGQKNRDKMLNFLTPFMERGRRQRIAPAHNGRRVVEQPRDFDITQLRTWAASNDIDVPQRGRIPGAIVEQYKAAGGR